VVTEVDKAAGLLFWAVKEMERRYQLFSKANARDLPRYNNHLLKRGERPIPYIVIVVDEMADLMMAAPEEVEKHICRLAQMARAVGIHLIIATQRPSVDVITGLIKANFPARIAFAVSSQTDSRVILDVPGAERLLGRGDMLFMAPDASKLERLQGTFVSDEEISRIVHHWVTRRTAGSDDIEIPDGVGSLDAAARREAASDPDGQDQSQPEARPSTQSRTRSDGTEEEQQPLFREIERLRIEDDRDDLFDEAVRVVQEAQRGSITLLQRRLRIGYGRAGRLIEQLEAVGVLGPDRGGSQGREYLGPGSHGAGTESDEPRATDDDSTRVWM
jgi:S-DNA-T family DNA segregation ATPase FtsK/SpoIIIE